MAVFCFGYKKRLQRKSEEEKSREKKKGMRYGACPGCSRTNLLCGDPRHLIALLVCELVVVLVTLVIVVFAPNQLNKDTILLKNLCQKKNRPLGGRFGSFEGLTVLSVLLGAHIFF